MYMNLYRLYRLNRGWGGLSHSRGVGGVKLLEVGKALPVALVGSGYFYLNLLNSWRHG